MEILNPTSYTLTPIGVWKMTKTRNRLIKRTKIFENAIALHDKDTPYQ